MKDIKVIFMGTPIFASIILDELIKKYNVIITNIKIQELEPNELSKTGDLIEDAIPMDIFNNNDFKIEEIY